MRILFTFIGGSGHLRPLLPFAQAARAAGHTVAVAGRGSRIDEIAGAGFTGIPTSPPNHRPPGAEEDPLTAPDRQREEQVMREAFAGGGARTHAEAVRRIALDWKPDVIVRDEVDFGSAIAAESLGIPTASVVVLLAGGLIRPDVVAEPLDELRAEYELDPDPDLTKLPGQLVIMPAPQILRDPRYALPAGTFYCRPSHAVAVTTPTNERPKVYFTLGTIDTFRELFDKVLAAARTIPVDLVVTVGPKLDPASFGPQPENVRIERFIPQDEILPTTDLVIAHGGSGTLVGSLAHGLPSILLPLGADQPHNADRCVALGTACQLDPITFTSKDAADCIMELTGKVAGVSFHEAARRVQAEINALPSPERAVALIEQLR
ncbi:glycosyltransferase [Actinospica robiniae]|uniref:glycosyltransferase n=1 Tax=Actinospica robiniae TaxID=304901 RepID=UPI000553AC42|nr:glycosyltransferase [Actinospica robiniae]